MRRAAAGGSVGEIEVLRNTLAILFVLAHNMNRIIKEGVLNMAQIVNVNFKMDAEDKRRMESACAGMGLSMSAAFTIFAKKVGRERRIPFEISAPDPFYDENNIRYLENKMADYKAGKLKMAEHELIEE